MMSRVTRESFGEKSNPLKYDLQKRPRKELHITVSARKIWKFVFGRTVGSTDEISAL